jgi:hypothetical protein
MNLASVPPRRPLPLRLGDNTGPEPTRDEALVRASIAAGFLIVAAIVLFPFLTTRYVTQDDSQLALLSWRQVESEALFAARVTGRIYFLVGSWFAWIPHVFDRFAYFKAVQMLGLLGNFLAFYYLARKLARSPAFALLALLVALVTMQARWEHDIVTAFPWAFSASLTLAMVAIGLFADYVDGGARWKQVVSACAFFLSLLTYESFLFYAVAFPLLAWPRGEPLGRRVVAIARAIWIHAALGALFVAAYAGFRVAFPSIYEGTQARFSPAGMFAVWKTFLVSALPGSAYRDLQPLFDEFSEGYAGYPGGIAAVFQQARVEWLVLAVLVALLCAWLLVPAAAGSRRSGLSRAAAVALVLACVPQIPHSLSPRYQDWVLAGVKSHVPTYFIGFGVSLLLAVAATAIARLVRGARPFRWAVGCGLALVALLTAFSNFFVAKSQTVARREWDLVDALVRSAPFAAVPDDAVVLAPSFWNGVNIMQVLEDYWTRYVERKSGKRVQIVRGLSDFRRACARGCGGRAYFGRYSRDQKGTSQFLVFSRMEGNPEDGALATSADVFVLAQDHQFSIYVGLRGAAASEVSIDGARVTDSAKGSAWLRVDRRGVHEAPLLLHLASRPALLDPDSIALSGSVDGGRFVDSVRPIFAAGFHGDERIGDTVWEWAQEKATLILRNESSSTREVTLSFASAGSAPSCHITMAPAGADPSTWSGALLEHRLQMRVGPWQDGEIHFSSDCGRAPGDPRNLRFNLRSVQISARVVSEPGQ